MEDEVVLKRRRVTQACESCRSLKSKCDGKRPVCSRCKGYGYECRWRDRNIHTTASDRLSEVTTNQDDEVDGLRHAITTCRQLLSILRAKLDEDDQQQVDSILASINSSRVKSPITSPTSSKCLDLLDPFRRSLPSSHRYLGEISDVSFFNSVKGLLQSDSGVYRTKEPLESYEREATELTESANDPGIESSKFFDRSAADKYITIYFSTIHIAYPYVDRKRFLEDYKKYWNIEIRSTLESTSIALLFTIFAIGSYYDVCTMPTEQSASLHYAYFQRALVAAGCIESAYSVDNVRVLLAQSFYLLLAQWTDRCWLTLGLAIRIAQSIGLHVEHGQAQNHTVGGQIELELQRRTWHSLYALDRLLSIQLGRPSAIRNQDCTVRLPSRLDDAEFDAEYDRIPLAQDDKPKTGDYFIAVIQLSAILRHVERDVYRPATMDYSDEMLQRTERLDSELLRWRSQLPRWLRFDRGHTFERSAILKRQRNMLAIKFHHLRALIHRPYLCLPWLQRNDNSIKQLLDLNAHRVVYFERICVQEAQATAHLLHDVTDKKSLVEDFPWWQMISCLICASSVLLVMRAFMPSSSPADNMQREVLEEDANTCLKVFDALSLNSDGARRARDMLQNLRDVRVAEERSFNVDLPQNPTLSQPEMNGNGHTWRHGGDQSPLGSEDSPSFVTLSHDHETMDERFPASVTTMWNRQDWPSEIADSMAFASQFVDAWDPLELPSETSYYDVS